MSQTINKNTPIVPSEVSIPGMLEKQQQVVVVVSEIWSTQTHEESPMPEQKFTTQATASLLYEHEQIARGDMQAFSGAAASRTTISRQPSSIIMYTRTHSRASSQSTRTSISEDDDIIAIALKADKEEVRKVVEDVVEKFVDVMVAEVKELNLRDFEVERKTKEGMNGKILEDEHVLRPTRPTLASARTNSYFDVKEGDSTPRRWRRKMDRNAMANPGASMYTRNGT